MKKIIFSLFLIIVIAIAAAAYFLLGNIDYLVKTGIEKYGSAVTQTSVRVENVEIKLADGVSTLKGLTIANPKGFDSTYAFSMGEVTLGIDLNSLTEEPYIINEITVKAPQVFVDMNENKKTNLNELIKNITGGTEKSKSKSTETSESKNTSGSKEPRLIIRSFTFEDGIIQANLKPLNKDYKLKLSRLIIKDLGGKNGVTPTELASEIINRLINQAKKDIQDKGLNAELDKIKEKINAKIEQQKAKLKAGTDNKIAAEKQMLENKLKDKLKGFLN